MASARSPGAWGATFATIHREIERDRCVEGYRPASAERRAWARKLRKSPKFRAVA